MCYGPLSNTSILAICESVFSIIVPVRSKCVQFGFLQEKAIKNNSSVMYPAKRTVDIYFFGGGGQGFCSTHDLFISKFPSLLI